MFFVNLFLYTIAIIELILIAVLKYKEFKSIKKTKESDKPPVEEETKENDLPRNLEESSKAAIKRYMSGGYYISYQDLVKQIEEEYLIYEGRKYLQELENYNGEYFMTIKEFIRQIDDDTIDNDVKKHVRHSKEYTEMVNKEKTCSNCAYMWTCRDKNYCFCSHSNHRCIEKDFYCQEWHDSDYTFEKYFK